MIRIELSTQISRPRDEVFEFLTDVGKLPKWQTGVVQSKAVSEGAMRVGYQFEETAKVAFWKLHTVCAVTDIKANERFAFTAKSNGPIDYHGQFDLQPVAGGTRLSVTGSVNLKGLWKLLQPVLAGDLRKETRAELETIRRLLEAGAPAPNGRETGESRA
ncbi:MAG TPA: SRPBCC family protein [Dehalococcoidia bacterium]|nr:SRPBCC family protein [Dehalococcoidia bacterium]